MRRGVVHDGALFQHDDVSRDKLDIRNNVRRYNDDLVERDFRDVVPDRDTLLRVQSRGRLVENQNLRIT